ncbi:MAG: family 16 glycosylhydrolase, partial [Acutalibacteraceae bacterium]|nr:family 16 glycosylhydrolase [Acutalibacteraceae bacterium]
MTKKLLALALSLVLTANIAACNYHDNEESSSQPPSSAPSSSDVASSDNASSEESTISSSKPSSGRPNIDGSQDGFKNNIPEPEPEKPDDDSDKDGGSVNDQFEGQVVVVPELTLAAGKTVNVSGQNAFTYKTATWNGPKGYALVIPYGDAEARRIAELVRNYFYYSTGTNLNISYDTVLTEGEKEILVGKTNRKDSNKNLKENEFNVRVSGKKLIFEAGHNATLETAVHRFFGIGISETVVPTFTCKNDFTSTLSFLSGYQYVWGDEFEGNELDFTKWSLDQKMGGFKDLQVSTGRDVIKVGDGRLTLSAIHKPNASKPYVVPCSTTTMRHMNFIYGYCEIRAKAPFYAGVWPSFWTQSTDVVSSKYGVYRTKNYFVEVDVFEVFGNKNTVVPNLHKWYDKNYYNY